MAPTQKATWARPSFAAMPTHCEPTTHNTCASTRSPRPSGLRDSACCAGVLAACEAGGINLQIVPICGYSDDMADRLYSDTDLAALYDAWWPRDKRNDVDFYLPLVMSAEAVLDSGCGTGALLHEARQSGHRGRLCGLDPGAGMLALARKRRDIEWVLGELASIDWTREFDLVVMTGHAFQALVEDDEIRKSLAAIRLALRDNG